MSVMKKIHMGKTGFEVSVLGLGCINFGTTTDEKLSFQLIDKYVELGGNLLDTSNNYAVWNGGYGRDSERVIGKWTAKNPSCRSDIYCAQSLEQDRKGMVVISNQCKKPVEL